MTGPLNRYDLSQETKIMATAMVHVRVDQKTKQRAAKTLAGLGISVSDAVRMLLGRVAAEKALPFDVKVPWMCHGAETDRQFVTMRRNMNCPIDIYPEATDCEVANRKHSDQTLELRFEKVPL